MNEHESWRELREAPAGGMHRLVAAIERRRQPRGVGLPPWWAAAAALLVATALTAIWHTQTRADATTRALEAAFARAANDGIVVANGAALELPSARADVRIFAIAALPAER